jgi:pimeloyl-ACP methyl ester carboxylesterase
LQTIEVERKRPQNGMWAFFSRIGQNGEVSPPEPNLIRSTHFHPSDLQGLARLAVDGVIGTTSLVEQLHHTIARVSPPLGTVRRGQTRGITGLVYRSIHRVTGLVGSTADLAFDQIIPRLATRNSSSRREAFLATLNGVVGDHLDASANPLAIPMTLRHLGKPLAMSAEALARTPMQPRPKLLVALHGLCMNDLQWVRQANGEQVSLPTELANSLGYTPLFLNYNTGLHISSNGQALATLLEQLVQAWPQPVDELVLLGHSMGGLVARSALHYARHSGHQWPNVTRKLIMLGSPHHGAPLERIGNKVDRLLALSPYSAPFTRLGQLRSAGITDLRHGNLIDEDWADGDRFSDSGDRRGLVGRYDHIDYHVIGAITDADPTHLKSRLLGDGLVLLDSALGVHPDPARHLAISPDHQWIAPATTHLGLIHCPRVRHTVYHWLA